ncbi:MAG: hypothetical protein ACI9LM_001041 [Alteromonadaceae bacterium]|jgi:hypothetical protein
MASDFITISNTRIKRSNIKSFGVSSERKEGRLDPISLLGSGIQKKRAGGSFFSGVKDSILPSPRKYLYVTTYQDDDHRFYGNEIDINEALSELENNQ